MEKMEEPSNNTALWRCPPRKYTPTFPVQETCGRFKLFQLNQKETATFWECLTQSAGVVFLSLWGRNIDGLLCKSLLFLHGRRGASSPGTAEEEGRDWQHCSAARAPVLRPTEGSVDTLPLNTSPSLFQVMDARTQVWTLPITERSSRKIQASKEAEMTTTSGPAIHLGTEILVPLRADLHWR